MKQKIEALTLLTVLLVASVAIFVTVTEDQSTGAMIVPQKYCRDHYWQYPHRMQGYEGCVPRYFRPTQEEFNPYDIQLTFYETE